MKISHLFLLSFFIITLACFCGVGNSFASRVVPASSFLHKLPASQEAGVLQSATYYSLDTSIVHRLLQSGGQLTITGFPISETESVTIELKPGHSVFDNNTKFIVATAAGDKELSAPELLIYRGIIAGDANSRVVVTFSGCGLLCSIHREQLDDMVLGQLRTSSDEQQYILIAEHKLLATSPFKPFNCMNDGKLDQNRLLPIEELLQNARNPAQGKFGIQKVNTSSLLETEIAIEADNDFYKAAGNDPQKAAGYIGAMFAMASSIYEDEAHITFRIPWIKTWATADPYQVHGDAYQLPDKVKAYWIANYSDVHRDLAHVMTSINYGGGGFGWFSLCDNNQSYSVSSPQTGHDYPTFAFTYDVYIISHEIGHNFSLPHSHDCYWNPPLDTCHTKDDPNTSLQLGDACFSLPLISKKAPGTIMSYCAGTNYTLSNNNFAEYKLAMTFSARVDSVMRVNAEAAPCVTSPTVPTVLLTAPRGSATYKGDSTISILWAYANIQNVTLESSSDAGATWTSIQTNIPAADGSYNWKIPNTSSTKMLVRISDAATPSKAADTSLMFFTVQSIAKPTYSNLQLVGVSGGKIDANKATQFTWSHSGAVGSGTIQLSTDQTNWSDILTVGESASSMSWTTPDENIPAAYFKITNKSGVEFATTTPVWIFKELGDVKNIGGAPTAFTMSSNFPNPVSSTTTIKFDIAKRQFVNLSVRNELGQPMMQLVNETLDVGSYDASFNVKYLPSGYYTYVLESEGIKLVGKMQVVK